MDKKQIAAVLKEMAVLMEILGSNPFKIRAHENAARALEGLATGIAELIKNNELTSIKGIGKGIADKIAALYQDGKIAEHQELKDKVPSGLLEVAKINGMGPKKVRAVWKELGIESVEQLQEAASGGKLAGMKGFGAKTETKILQNIELLKKYQDSFLLAEALTAGRDLLEAVKSFPEVIRCELAGSLRRRKEVVKDIDIVASAKPEDNKAIMEKFTSLEMVEVINGKGETKSSVVLSGGISADLRVVEDFQFPYTLHHFTGSREHNVAMRQHAIARGMKVSEWGLFDGERLVECADEKALFAALDMDYVEPELRENYGEVEAALSGELPDLITEKDIRGIIHAHSTWSDGVNSLEEMATACQEKGYEYLAISDHSRAAAYANGLSVERIYQQHQEIDKLNQGFSGFRILKSIECDILANGDLDYDSETLSTFDLVIASIHSKFGMTEKEGTERMIRAIKNPYVTILGHLTGRLLLSRDGYPVDQQAVLEAAGEHGVAVEINANPRRLDLDWRLCKFALEKNVVIAINPDAHRISGLDDMQYGVGIARKGWLTSADVLNCRSWQEVLDFARKRR